MPNLDVYATPDDLEAVLDAVFGAAAGLVLIEFDSRPDQPIRRFRSAREALDAIDLDADSANLGIHDRSLGDAIEERWIEFRPGAVPGASGRTTVAGWGLIQLHVPMTEPGRLRAWHSNHDTAARARSWLGEDADTFRAWDWAGIARLSGRINRQIRALAVDRVGSRPILPGAAARIAEGWRIVDL